MTDGLTDTDIKAVLALTPVECKGNKGNKNTLTGTYDRTEMHARSHLHIGNVTNQSIAHLRNSPIAFIRETRSTTILVHICMPHTAFIQRSRQEIHTYIGHTWLLATDGA